VSRRLGSTMRYAYAHLAPEHLCVAVSRLAGLTSAQPAKASAQASTQEPAEIEEALQK
jgi:hypothetical protein